MKWVAAAIAAPAIAAAAITGAYRRQWRPCLCGHPFLTHLGRWNNCYRCGCSAYLQRRP